jgi:hypothetical protein
MLLQDLDAILHYYVVRYSLPSGKLILLPGNRFDMARILAHLSILLIGTNACTPGIISSMWGENKDACLALGGPRRDLSFIHWRLLALSKIVINSIYIWTKTLTYPSWPPNHKASNVFPPLSEPHYYTPAKTADVAEW